MTSDRIVEALDVVGQRGDGGGARLEDEVVKVLSTQAGEEALATALS